MFWNLDKKKRNTRTRQLEQGALIDTGGRAAAAGFTCPVDLTRQAWADAVQWDGDPRVQDQDARLMAVMETAFIRALQADPRDTCIPFAVYRVPNTPQVSGAERIALSLTMGRGDAGEAIATIRALTDY
ncbi:DUF6573 family protein [Curtobacterium sp. MCBD17_026]|uniref:DUF6573 family protein n=1 Tax=Curtobacterium sp. MCBD17_026 TaxID=2175621 RepID=UPI000DAA1CCC|nr:DUF6573 family protein [Curtobacterium sp. MCBD17_026]WIB72574.1 hypothetical protein DEI85_17440 [Curtobacterium sp. MCBD17_026]